VRAPRIAAFSGRYLVRGGDPRALEGNCSPKRVVVLGFDGPGHAAAFYRSAQCQEALATRQPSSPSSHLFLLNGSF